MNTKSPIIPQSKIHR
ncbi:O6-methylguanine-DNA methyltransferase domain protein, partial [Yersinia pestis PY-42]